MSPINSALSAAKTVLLKSGGLTNAALDATQRSNFCQSASTWRRSRQKLASIGEGLATKVASEKKSMPMFLLDNMNFRFQWFSQDLTQGVLIHKDVDISGYKMTILQTNVCSSSTVCSKLKCHHFNIKISIIAHPYFSLAWHHRTFFFRGKFLIFLKKITNI